MVVSRAEDLEEDRVRGTPTAAFSIAYRMVGSASEAEDIVQEAFLRLHRETSQGTDIESPKARVSTVTTRLAINHVQPARVRRESYVGTWLAEPLITDTASEGARHADRGGLLGTVTPGPAVLSM